MLYCTDSQHMFFQSHYSIKKASAALGFGTENLILLNTDERFALYSTNMETVQQEIKWLCDLLCDLVFRGRVIPADLEAKVIEAKQKVNESDIVLSNFCFHCAMRNSHMCAVEFNCSYRNTYVCQSSKVISIRLMLLSTYIWCCPGLKYLSWK